tara:strand:+ start:222 stop:476 length:255 start_codon:yes stop_codon:yes gene_type:complete
MKNAWVYNMKDEPVSLATELEIELSQSNVPSGIFTCPMTGDSLYVQERRDEEEEENFWSDWAKEIAREEGALHGMESYNDWMGY